MGGLIGYLCKYILKAETRTSFLNELEDLLHRQEQRRPFTSIEQACKKVLRESTADRDYSAQEVTHHLFAFEPILKSRGFVRVALDSSREVDPDTHELKENLFDAYWQTPGVIPLATEYVDVTSMSFLEFASVYQPTRGGLWRRRPQGREAVVRTFPKPKIPGPPRCRSGGGLVPPYPASVPPPAVS